MSPARTRSPPAGAARASASPRNASRRDPGMGDAACRGARHARGRRRARERVRGERAGCALRAGGRGRPWRTSGVARSWTARLPRSCTPSSVRAWGSGRCRMTSPMPRRGAAAHTARCGRVPSAICCRRRGARGAPGTAAGRGAPRPASAGDLLAARSTRRAHCRRRARPRRPRAVARRAGHR